MCDKENGLITIYPKTQLDCRVPYEHQRAAMHNMDLMDKCENYSTLIVLPTGGGKTYTAVSWLLSHAVNKDIKVLWIAHRSFLLNQAAETFQQSSYESKLPRITSYTCRIISGEQTHGHMDDIDGNESILVISKDTLIRNLELLDIWLKDQNELYFVIDEAHHAPAKSYRRIISYIKSKVDNVKLIGLTATPFRTREDEKGLLAKVFSDGVKNESIVRDDIGISYQINLKDLIGRGILSKPIFEIYYTEESFDTQIGSDDINKIQHLDQLPENIVESMVKSGARNKLIVDTYVGNQEKYGQTIVFAINSVHAIQLASAFKKRGIPSDYVISSTTIASGGRSVSANAEENAKKIQNYRDGKIKVLININILTEGVDIPETKTVFLTRPTVSTILMTQMVGRALRGEAAGGTKEAYIVTFIDDWNKHIAWVNPDTLFNGGNACSDDPTDQVKRDIRMMSAAKIEEFAAIVNDSIPTIDIERIPFVRRIPIGMYAFTYLEEGGMDISYQIMVYDSTQSSYNKLMDYLPELFDTYNIDTEYLTQSQINVMRKDCKKMFFRSEMIPPYDPKDIANVLKYYAQFESAPDFYTFDEVDRSKLDVSAIAKKIWDEDMSERQKTKYLDSIWNDGDDNLLRLFFGKKIYFLKQIDIEKMKIAYPGVYDET